jgi:hypothetical protein
MLTNLQPRSRLNQSGPRSFQSNTRSLGHQYGSQIVSQPSYDSQMRDISNKIYSKKFPTPVNISVLQFYRHNYDRNERKCICQGFRKFFCLI